MEEIFDIANAFEICHADALTGAVIFHVTDQQSVLLKKAGDMAVSGSDEQAEITIYAGNEKARDRWRKTGGRIASWVKSHCPKSASVDCGPANCRELLVGLFLGAYEFSKYKEAPKADESVLYNEYPGLDFGDLRKFSSDEKIDELCQYLNSESPTLQNEYTGLFEGYNLI